MGIVYLDYWPEHHKYTCPLEISFLHAERVQAGR